MLVISHVVAGATIASFVPATWIAIPLAFTSHFLLDMIPHAQAPTDEGYRPNKRTYLFVGLDILAVVAFLYFFGPTIKAFFIILASVVPDLFDLTRYNKYFYRVFRPFYDFHDKIQRETNKPIGFITQILLIVGCLLLIGVTR